MTIGNCTRHVAYAAYGRNLARHRHIPSKLHITASIFICKLHIVNIFPIAIRSRQDSRTHLQQDDSEYNRKTVYMKEGNILRKPLPNSTSGIYLGKRSRLNSI